jgi:SAM-dependent methyltransferase
MSDRSDWLYAAHAARALTGGPGVDDLYIHFGHFDDAADSEPYGGMEGRASRFHAAQRALDEQVRGLAGLADGQRVLDVGCGVGGTLAAIDAAHRGMTLIGVNIDPLQLEAARARVRARADNRIEWRSGEALALPLGAASVDRVLAVEAAPHFGSRARFLVEAARVLVDGGVLALSDFVPTPALREARDRGALPDGFAHAVATGLGPFEDIFGDGPGYPRMAAGAALEPLAAVDATRATLPTYRYLLREPPDRVLAAPDAAPADRGVAALAWAQERDLMRMCYLAFRRAPRG